MKCNIGRVDKSVRTVLGLAMIAVGLVFKSPFGLIGLIPLATATVGWCPLYLPFGINTCKTKK